MEEIPTTAEYNQILFLFNARRYVELENRTRQVLEGRPDSGFAWKALGAALRAQGKDSLSALRKAAELLPDDAEAHNNLGVVLKDHGQLEDAVACYRFALEFHPGYSEAHSNLGNALQDLGQLDRAVESYGRALQINPYLAEAHSNLGVALNSLGRLDDAVASYRRALQIKPGYAETHCNLGVTLRDLGQLDDATASYRRALEINSDYADAHNNLANVMKDLGRLGDAVTSYRRALAINAEYAEAHSNLLFLYNYLSEQPAEMLLAEACCFGNLAARLARPYTHWSNIPDSGRCLRVGMVSGDLNTHPVGYFVEGMLAALASNAAGRIELIAYPNTFRSDELTERIKASCHGWHSAAGLSDDSLARQIRGDGIDILLDLSGHTAYNRLPLFARKLAPVQASWLGYFATTGVAAMDYLIADPWTLPETEEAFFTEQIWRLPETRLCFTPPEMALQVAPLPALTNGHITFGCFNNLTKMNDAVVALWARIIASVPNSRLFLKSKQLREAAVRQSIHKRFAAHGVLADSLILEGLSPRREYLEAYNRVDIALDPFPFPGGTTSAESLWMGVPVLTLAGASFVSRQGVGLLMNAGLPNWVAADADDYLALAVAHAGNPQRLSALRSELRQQVLASPLFDAPRFAHHFEVALRGMWTQWCDHEGRALVTETQDKSAGHPSATHRAAPAT